MRASINFTIKDPGHLQVNPQVRVNAVVPEAKKVSNKLIIGEKEFDGSEQVEITAEDLGAITEIPVASEDTLGAILTGYVTPEGSDNRPVKVDEEGNAYVTIPSNQALIESTEANSKAIINLQNDVNDLEDSLSSEVSRAQEAEKALTEDVDEKFKELNNKIKYEDNPFTLPLRNDRSTFQVGDAVLDNEPTTKHQSLINKGKINDGDNLNNYIQIGIWQWNAGDFPQTDSSWVYNAPLQNGYGVFFVYAADQHLIQELHVEDLTYYYRRSAWKDDTGNWNFKEWEKFLEKPDIHAKVIFIIKQSDGSISPSSLSQEDFELMKKDPRNIEFIDSYYAYANRYVYVYRDHNNQTIYKSISNKGYNISEYILEISPMDGSITLRSNPLSLSNFKDDIGVSNKLDKVTTQAGAHRVYTVNPNGYQRMRELGYAPGADTIPVRYEDGRIKVGTPTESDDATNKDYVDNKVTDINTALTKKADLDETGKVPASQLPAFVDDVIEYENFEALPTTGETGKIYVTLNDNLTYRWSGTRYVEISKSLALGETPSTAYMGSKGKKNAEDIAANKEAISQAQSDITSLQQNLQTTNTQVDKNKEDIAYTQDYLETVDETVTANKNNINSIYELCATYATKDELSSTEDYIIDMETTLTDSINTKLDKVSTATPKAQAYVKAMNGDQIMLNTDINVTPYGIPEWDKDGHLYANDPVDPKQVTNKNYVDEKLGEKLDKKVPEYGEAAYAVNNKGEDYLKQFTPKAIAYHLMERDEHGKAMVQTPTETDNPLTIATKEYVDPKLDKQRNLESGLYAYKAASGDQLVPYHWKAVRDAFVVRNENAVVETKTDETNNDSSVNVEFLNNKLKDIREVAEGKTATYVISNETYPSFNTNDDTISLTRPFSLTSIGETITIQDTDLKLGDIVLVTQIDVPDRYVGGITDTEITFYKMETSKVDLTDINTEINNLKNDKLDKNTSVTPIMQAYIKNADGSNTMLNIDEFNRAWALVKRDANKTFMVGEPYKPENPATKNYVDNFNFVKTVDLGGGVYEGTLTEEQYNILISRRSNVIIFNAMRYEFNTETTSYLRYNAAKQDTDNLFLSSITIYKENKNWFYSQYDLQSKIKTLTIDASVQPTILSEADFNILENNLPNIVIYDGQRGYRFFEASDNYYDFSVSFPITQELMYISKLAVNKTTHEVTRLSANVPTRDYVDTAVNTVSDKLNTLEANVQDYYTPDVTYDLTYSGWQYKSAEEYPGSGEYYLLEVVPDQKTSTASPLRGTVISNATQIAELQSFKNATIAAINSYGRQIPEVRSIAQSAESYGKQGYMQAISAQNQAASATGVANEAKAMVGDLDRKTESMYGAVNQANIQRLYNDELPTDPVVGQVFNLINSETKEEKYFRWNGTEWEELYSKLDDKLDKITNTSSYDRVYVKDKNGNQIMLDLIPDLPTIQNKSIPLRNAAGTFDVPTPPDGLTSLFTGHTVINRDYLDRVITKINNNLQTQINATNTVTEPLQNAMTTSGNEEEPADYIIMDGGNASI